MWWWSGAVWLGGHCGGHYNSHPSSYHERCTVWARPSPVIFRTAVWSSSGGELLIGGSEAHKPSSFKKPNSSSSVPIPFYTYIAVEYCTLYYWALLLCVCTVDSLPQSLSSVDFLPQTFFLWIQTQHLLAESSCCVHIAVVDSDSASPRWAIWPFADLGSASPCWVIWPL